jgi:predicted metal-dependent hydrolase
MQLTPAENSAGCNLCAREATLADVSRIDPPGAFRRGIEQFNAGRFFEAHETWEEVWLRSSEPEKTFLQGIIQMAAAFHHYSRGNTRGARSLLEASLARLARFPSAHRGMQLAALRAEAQTWAAALAAGAVPEPEVPLPQIRFAAED